MIRYELSVEQNTVTIALPVTDGNSRARMAIGGDKRSVQSVRDLLMKQCGAFGHGMSETTTAYDLDAALKAPAMDVFNPRLIEGVIGVYDPEIPDGAMT